MEILARSRARVGIPKSMVPRLVAGAGGSDLSQPSVTFRMSRRTKGWGYPSVGYPSLPYHLPPGTFAHVEQARAHLQLRAAGGRLTVASKQADAGHTHHSLN